MAKKTLVLVHEREADCLGRLRSAGLSELHAGEVSSYLAQSTDMTPEVAALENACADHGVRFSGVTLDDFIADRHAFPPADTLVWALTDGIAYFSGSAAPAVARLEGYRRIGAEDALFALCQDKFRSGAVLAGLGLTVPATAIVRDGDFLSPASVIASAKSWFVKPNRLGAKIGIYDNSHCHSLDDALTLSQRIYADYRDDAVVQAYVPGVNIRASWLDLDGQGDLSRLGIWRVAATGDFQTMADSLALYGETGAEAKAAGAYHQPELVDVRQENPAAATTIIDMTRTLMRGLGLADVFSLDFRVGDDGSVTLLEFEVCPGLPCFDFRAYVRASWGLSLADAMAKMAARKLA